MKYVTIFLGFEPRFNLQVSVGSDFRINMSPTNRSQTGQKYFELNLILGHSRWNILPSFNVAFGGKSEDLRRRAIDFARISYCRSASLCILSFTPIEVEVFF